MILSDERASALAAVVGCGAVVMERAAFEAAAPGMAEGLVADGLLVAWERDSRGDPLEPPLVTLTPRAADLLRVEIVELGPNWQVWDDAGKPPRPVVADRSGREYRLPHPEMVVDHRPGPAQEAEYLMDSYSGEPITILGRMVPIDRRMGRGKRAG